MRSSRRKKRQPARQSAAAVTSDPSEDGSEATATKTLNADKILASGAHHSVEAQAHTRSNEYSSSSAQQRTDNGLDDESTSEETAAEGRTRVSDRSMKRRHGTETNEQDSEAPATATKRSKKTKDIQSVLAGEHTNTPTKESVPIVEENLENQYDSPMETDSEEDMEEDNKQEHGYTAAEADFSNITTRESLMHRTMPYHTQKQTLSSVVHSSTENVNVWLSSNAVDDKRYGSYIAAASPQSRQQMVEPDIRGRIVSESPHRWLSAYHYTHSNAPSAEDHVKPESPRQKHELNCPVLCNVLTYFLLTSVVAVLAILLAFLLTTGGEPYYSQWLAGMKLPSTKPDAGNDDVPVSIGIQFKRLRAEFPNQTDRLWRIMESATSPIIEEDDPTHPAVILLVASRGNSAVAECLAGRYAALVTESLGAAQHATVNCELYADSDPDDAKAQLNTALSRAFDSGSKSGVVLRLEKLPGPAAMIFYRFADNDNAPYKDVAIVLTLTLESTDTGSGKDNVAYDELRKVWGSSLDVDQVDPLLSRIGNSVAFVQPETRDVLAGLNC